MTVIDSHLYTIDQEYITMSVDGQRAELPTEQTPIPTSHGQAVGSYWTVQPCGMVTASGG
jgi:hypothetical protein